MPKKPSKIVKKVVSWRPSLLYFTFLMCSLVLFMRLGQMAVVILSGDESFLEASMFGQASAEDKAGVPKETPKPTESATSDKPVDKKSESAQSPETQAKTAAEQLSPQVKTADKGGLEKPKETVAKPDFDPFNLSEGEVKLLFTLDKKRKELDMREQDIMESKKQLQVIEKRVEQKIDELKTIKTAIKKIVEEEDEQVSKNTQRLVGIYQGMKPKAAAKVFDDLPMSVLKKVVQNMDQKKVSPIMASMDVKKVKKLTTLLAQPSPLDLPQKKLEEDPTQAPAEQAKPGEAPAKPDEAAATQGTEAAPKQGA